MKKQLAWIALMVGGLIAMPALAQGEAGSPAEATGGDAAATATDMPADVAAGDGDAAEPAAEPEAAEPPPTAADLQTADEDYNLKVKGLEARINELKEQIFRSKAKLTLLTEQVTGGLGTGATVVIISDNEMSGAFRLVEAQFFLDGAPIWQDIDETGKRLGEMKERTLYDGGLVEGSHTINVKLVYQGDGSGVFSYLDGYKATLRNALTFKAEPGKIVTVRVHAFEKGNFTTEMMDRPTVEFIQDVAEDTRPKRKEGN